jgi:predicted membrane protein
MPGMDHVISKAFLATGGSIAYPQWSVVQQVAAVGVTPAACALAPITLGVAAAAPPLGVCQEQLDAVKTATNKAFVNVALDGNVKCIWDGTTGGTTPWATVGIAPAIGALVVCSQLVPGRVKFISAQAAYLGWQVLGTLLSLPGSPLPTFGANAAAGDIFDVALTIGTRA